MEAKMTKVQIIEETLKFYKKNPRSIKYDSDGDQEDCYYNHPSNGSHCAVGRCMLLKLKQKGSRLKGNSDAVAFIDSYEARDSIDSSLSPKYRGHSINFWVNLQNLHDMDENWEAKKTVAGNKLTDAGKQEFNNLLKKYAKEE